MGQCQAIEKWQKIGAGLGDCKEEGGQVRP